MRSPVPGLSASEGDKVSDSTPLLQDAPQAEAGEQRSGPTASGDGSPAAGWPEYPRPRLMGPELLRPRVGRESGEPRREGTLGKRSPLRAPLSPLRFRCPEAAPGPRAGEDREARPNR